MPTAFDSTNGSRVPVLRLRGNAPRQHIVLVVTFLLCLGLIACDEAGDETTIAAVPVTTEATTTTTEAATTSTAAFSMRCTPTEYSETATGPYVGAQSFEIWIIEIGGEEVQAEAIGECSGIFLIDGSTVTVGRQSADDPWQTLGWYGGE
jgi:hypothetical protein